MTALSCSQRLISKQFRTKICGILVSFAVAGPEYPPSLISRALESSSNNYMPITRVYIAQLQICRNDVCRFWAHQLTVLHLAVLNLKQVTVINRNLHV